MIELLGEVGAEWLYRVWAIVVFGTVVATVVVVLSENRNPVKSLAWVTVLMLLPVAGIILYFFFGRNIRNKRKLSRRSRRQLKKRERAPHADPASMGLSVDTAQTIALGKAVSGAHFYDGNDVEIFTDGAAKFEALERDLREARESINLEYYIFSDDATGRRIADILEAKARAGVAVRVIYDHVGSFAVGSRFFKRMAEAGVQVFPFFKVTFPVLGSHINWRNHRKICIIDRSIAYCGGMNIADRYITGGRFAQWRDTHVRVRGPVVAALLHAFAVDWHMMGQPLFDTSMPSPRQRPGAVGAQLLTSSPISQWSNIALMFHKAVSGAKKRVYIQTPYFLPTDSLLKALTAAALARVDVRIMIPRRSDSHLLDSASASYITECMRAGIKFYLYEAGMLHSKLIVIDDEFTTIGSTNFDFRSFEHNFEGNLFLYSKDVATQAIKIFNHDITQSTRIVPSEWRSRPLGRRAVESVVRLLSPIL